MMMTMGSTYAFGQQLTCYPIRRGDTAARLAQSLTANADNRYQPWFQIVNPATATLIPKSRYGVIQSGWRVCVAPEMLRRGPAEPRDQFISSAPRALLPTGVTQERTTNDLRVLWWAIPLFVIVSSLVVAWVATGKYIGERRASLDIMKGFGDRFISEFEQPLFRGRAADPPVKSRLRFATARHRLDVLLAPADGRTYPNLFDHRKNVEYDVARVLRLLRDERFINGPLYVDGSWVVIPFRFETDRQQEGVL